MQTTKTILKTELFVLVSKNTKLLPSSSNSSLIISHNTPPKSIETLDEDSLYIVVCGLVTNYCRKPLKWRTKMHSNQSQLHEQHVHPSALQRRLRWKKHQDHLHSWHGTFWLVDILIDETIMSCGKWSFFAQTGNPWNWNARFIEFHLKCWITNEICQSCGHNKQLFCV